MRKEIHADLFGLEALRGGQIELEGARCLQGVPVKPVRRHSDGSSGSGASVLCVTGRFRYTVNLDCNKGLSLLNEN